MAVVSSKQNDEDLKVLNYAEELLEYTFAWHRFSIATNSIEYWTGLIVKTVNKAKSWNLSDKRRYEEMRK